MFAISCIPPLDLIILNNLEVRENYLRNSLDTLVGAIPVSFLPHNSCRKPIAVVTHTNEVLLNYKTICFTDGSKLDRKVGLACVIYKDGAEKAAFHHRLRDECTVFQSVLILLLN